MTVTIRLARLGCRNHPFYRVVVADSTCARDGKNLEVLGFYNPISGKDEEKRMALKFERVNLLETYVKYGKTLHIGGIVLIAATRVIIAPNLHIFYFWYWLSVGAQPSETVERLLFRAGLLPPPPVVAMGHKGGPHDANTADALTGGTLNQEQPANANHNEDAGISPEAIFSIGLQVN